MLFRIIFSGVLCFLTLPSLAATQEGAAQELRSMFTTQVGAAKTEFSESLADCVKHVATLQTKDPILGTAAEVKAKIYGESSSSVPTVIIMPPTGGENVIDNWWANALCASGFRVAILLEWSYDKVAELDVGMHDRNAIRAMNAVNLLVSYLGSTKKLGILGTSVGAMSAAFALGLDSRIQNAVLIVGGAPMSQINAYSNEKTLVRLREGRIRDLGLESDQAYEKYLVDHVKYSPDTFAGYSGPKNVLSIMASHDRTVLTRFQKRLHLAFRSRDMIHEAVVKSGDHRGVILKTPLTETDRIIQFFKDTMMSQGF